MPGVEKKIARVCPIELVALHLEEPLVGSSKHLVDFKDPTGSLKGAWQRKSGAKTSADLPCIVLAARIVWHSSHESLRSDADGKTRRPAKQQIE